MKQLRLPRLFFWLLALLIVGCSDSGEMREINIFDPHHYGEWVPDETGSVDGEDMKCAPDAPKAVIYAVDPNSGEELRSPDDAIAVEPLDTVELRVELYVRGDHEGEYETPTKAFWRISERPGGSTSGLGVQDETQTSLWMQLAGRYTVEVDVWDARGVRSCEPARMSIEAVPESDIHVQLVWHTPADPDETDLWGSDMDLHLMHPRARGRWDHPRWDCHWENPNPDWGRTDYSEDNPSLDLDDIDGAGPENINLNNPENGAEYLVGVHYFADHDFGPSFATVRIYIGGKLSFESPPMPMTHRERRFVAAIRWPSGEVVALD